MAAVGATEAVTGREAVALAAETGRVADVVAALGALAGRAAEVVVEVAAVAGRVADEAELAVGVGFMEEVASFLGWDV